MRLNVVQLGAITIAGVYCNDENTEEGFQINNLINHIDTVEEKNMYEVYDREHRLIGKRIDKSATTPDGCVVVAIPSGKYAKPHPHHGVYMRDLLAKSNYRLLEDAPEFSVKIRANGEELLLAQYYPVEYCNTVLNVRTMVHLDKESSQVIKNEFCHRFVDRDSSSFRKFSFKRYEQTQLGYLWGLLKWDLSKPLSLKQQNNFLLRKLPSSFFGMP